MKLKYNTKLYYTNELTDEVLEFNNKQKNINNKFKYISKNPFFKLLSFLTYRLILTPFAWISFKLFKRIKFINKHILKQHKKNGYFIFANHTNQFGDVFCPTLICFPKKPYIVVNSSNLSTPILGNCLKMWGALPLPNTISSTKNFYDAIDYRLKKNNPILIYPEAHLWPYYTKIRNFSSASFRYPVKFNKPVFTFTTVYKLKKIGKKPKVEIFVDGPFYPDLSLPDKQAQEKLRNEIFNQMNERSKNSNYEYLKYIKRGTND